MGRICGKVHLSREQKNEGVMDEYSGESTEGDVVAEYGAFQQNPAVFKLSGSGFTVQ